MKYFRKGVIVTVICLFCGLYSVAGVRDSLLQKASIVTKPEAKANLYNQLADYYFNNNTDSSLYFASRALGIARNNELIYDWALAQTRLGQIAQDKKDFVRAINHFKGVIEMGERYKDPTAQIIGYYKRGMLNFDMASFSNANNAFFTALDISIEIENHAYTSELYRQIGNTFRRLQSLSKAKEYYNKALISSNKAPDWEIGNAAIYVNFGLIMADAGMVDSALYYYHNAKHTFEKLGNQEEKLVSLYSNLGQLHGLKTNRIDSGKIYLRKSLLLAEKLNDKENEIRNILSLAELDIAVGNYRAALPKVKQAVALNDVEQNLYIWPFIYENLAIIEENTSNHSAALIYERQRAKYADSIKNIRTYEITRTLEAEYQADKANQTIVEQKLEILQSEKRGNRVEIMALVFGLILGLVLFCWFMYSRFFVLRRRAEKIKDEHNHAMQLQRIADLENMAEIRAMNAMLDGREKERRAIAETLHDSVSTLLSSANMHLQAVKAKANGQTKQIAKSQAIIKEASDKVRLLSHHLMSSVLVKFGLPPAIADLCDKISTDELDFAWECQGCEHRLPRELENKIYSMVEELCNNILKHSDSSQASILLKRVDANISVTVEDNGKGFDPRVVESSSGIGLGHIRARVRGMKGKMHIQSNPDEGSKIQLLLPLPKDVLEKIADEAI